MSKRWGDGTMVVPSPVEVDELMRRVRRGGLTRINDLRAALAAKHGVDFACPMTTGIFAWIAAHAAAEQEAAGKRRGTPWWRTLKTGGELNAKFPGGTDEQARRLRAEGHRVVARGKRWFVAGKTAAACWQNRHLQCAKKMRECAVRNVAAVSRR